MSSLTIYFNAETLRTRSNAKFAALSVILRLVIRSELIPLRVLRASAFFGSGLERRAPLGLRFQSRIRSEPVRGAPMRKQTERPPFLQCEISTAKF